MTFPFYNMYKVLSTFEITRSIFECATFYNVDIWFCTRSKIQRRKVRVILPKMILSYIPSKNMSIFYIHFLITFSGLIDKIRFNLLWFQIDKNIFCFDWYLFRRFLLWICIFINQAILFIGRIIIYVEYTSELKPHIWPFLP